MINIQFIDQELGLQLFKTNKNQTKQGYFYKIQEKQKNTWETKKKKKWTETKI